MCGRSGNQKRCQTLDLCEHLVTSHPPPRHLIYYPLLFALLDAHKEEGQLRSICHFHNGHKVRQSERVYVVISQGLTDAIHVLRGRGQRRCREIAITYIYVHLRHRINSGDNNHALPPRRSSQFRVLQMERKPNLKFN